MKKLVCTIMLALMTAISATVFASVGIITYKPGDTNSVMDEEFYLLLTV